MTNRARRSGLSPLLLLPGLTGGFLPGLACSPPPAGGPAGLPGQQLDARAADGDPGGRDGATAGDLGRATPDAQPDRDGGGDDGAGGRDGGGGGGGGGDHGGDGGGGAGDGGGDGEDGGGANAGGALDGSWPQDGYTIRIEQAEWPQVHLHYRLQGQGWTPLPGAAMQREGGSWWSGRTPPGRLLEFVFNDGGDRWYPGGAANNLLTGWPAVHVRDGLIFTHHPDLPRPPGELVVLTVNLHTYQEQEAAAKLDRVADTIAALRADFVCFQECAQHSGAAVMQDPAAFSPFAGEPIRADNMARLITDRLRAVHGATYRYAWSWAHHGWNVWEEGVAVLTPHPILEQEQRYVSTQRGTGTIDSRKAVYLAAQLPDLGRLHVFSAHTSWGQDQEVQIRNLKAFLAEKAGAAAPLASLLCGDFNAPAGQQGHALLVSPEGGRLVDTYLEANPGHGADPTMPGDGTRIDYIFYAEGAPLQTRTAQIYFKHHPLLGGRVSDHFGQVSRLGLRR
ncbi:MAG: hypothetical protein FJ125_05715 [Deltaproteobacteria bacterium]|nr:hypothetical protein [Deltaproteobacteria bacterium]